MITVFSDKPPISLTGKEYTFDVTNDKVTDSYHSMEELYDIRRALCVELFNSMSYTDEGRLFGAPNVVKSKLHNDGTMYEGYFIIYAFVNGGPISFHYALEHWDKFEIPEVERIPWEYNGHTMEDVINRLESNVFRK